MFAFLLLLVAASMCSPCCLSWPCRDHPLESLTQLYTDLMRGADITPADEVVAVLLLGAHQRNMRKRHIKCKLAGKTCCQGPSHLCQRPAPLPPGAMQQPDKQQPHNYPQQDDNEEQNDIHLNTSHIQHLCHPSTSGSDGPSHDTASTSSLSTPQATDRQRFTERQPQHGQAASSGQQVVHAESQQQDAAVNGCQPSVSLHWPPNSRHMHDDSASNQDGHYQVAERQQQSDTKQQHAAHDGKKGQSRRPGLKDMHLASGVDVEQGWGRGDDADDSDTDVDYDKDDGDVAVFERGEGCGFPCVLTPSSMAAELAPHLTQQQAADIYLGEATHVH